MRWILPALAGTLLNLTAEKAHDPPRIPVVVQSDPNLDACFGVGVVKGLNPHHEGFLAVRGGPSVRFAPIDKLHNEERVYLCTESGDWYGIVYTKTSQDCNVSTPWLRPAPYKGPCRSGWVYKRWIELLAG